jgi:hypothetical protein
MQIRIGAACLRSRAAPPNATVSAFNKDGSQIHDAVIVMKTPKLERLIFDVDVLEGNLTGADGPAAVFIDRFGFAGGFARGGFAAGGLGRAGVVGVGHVGYGHAYVNRGAWYRGGAVGLGAAAVGGAAIGAAAAGLTTTSTARHADTTPTRRVTKASD